MDGLDRVGQKQVGLQGESPEGNGLEFPDKRGRLAWSCWRYRVVVGVGVIVAGADVVDNKGPDAAGNGDAHVEMGVTEVVLKELH